MSSLNQPAIEVSVVVPFYNEAGNVQALADRVLDSLSSQVERLELVLVDDGSSDETWEKIQLAQRREPRIRPVRHVTNQGQSAALFSGFRASHGKLIATLDGDLQNDPADLPRMLAELETCDMVCGARVSRQDKRMRRISSRVARWARKLALGIDFADSGCNLRVFKRSILDVVPAFKGVHRFLPILASNAGARVKEIPVSHHPRRVGVSKYGLWNRLGCGIFDLIMVAMFLRRQLRWQPATDSEREKPSDSRPSGA